MIAECMTGTESEKGKERGNGPGRETPMRGTCEAETGEFLELKITVVLLCYHIL